MVQGQVQSGVSSSPYMFYLLHSSNSTVQHRAARNKYMQCSIHIFGLNEIWFGLITVQLELTKLYFLCTVASDVHSRNFILVFQFLIMTNLSNVFLLEFNVSYQSWKYFSFVKSKDLH